MTDDIQPPTLPQFMQTVRAAFAFLRQFGFREISPPPHRGKERFQVWFSANDRFVIIKGEGYGTMAAVMLEHDGLELGEIDFVPAEERPQAMPKGRPGQLEQIHEAARRLEKHGADFLRGEMGRFLARARAIPPYKRAGSP
jgi:hypothetical protein